MAAITGTQKFVAQIPGRDSQRRLEVWEYQTTTTGVADEWVDVGADILAVCGVAYLGAGIAPAANFVLNGSGTSTTAGTSLGNLAVETNSVSGTHTFQVTVIVRP